MISEPVRLLLADDHAVVRTGLAQVLSEQGGFVIVAEAGTGEEALAACGASRPDIVLMDVMMPGMSGRDTVAAIRRDHPDVRIVALSAFADRRLRQDLLRAGALAVLSKAISATELVDSLRRVHGGDGVQAQADTADRDGDPSPGSSLGAQQRRVLALLTKGYTNAEIASYLGISLPTARYHVSALLVKLGVSNRAEAASFATRNYLITDSDF